ncbi:MAG: hypothetical protein J7M38_15275 [Armatimonadetes bacterium]|nr:hypothetical protein [Armatimonadota bacterium]
MRNALLLLALLAASARADLPTITIEAESYTEVTGGTVRVLSRPAASGGKCVSYWEEPGVAVTVPFEVTEAGDYCLTIRYSLNWDDTRRAVALDGETVPGLEDVTLPGTGSWSDFSAFTVPGPDGGRVRLSLTAGAHTLTLTNVDSRGLAWDAAVLHDPSLLPADAPLSEADLHELAERLPPPAKRLLLDGPREGDMVVGGLVVAYEPDALTTAHRLGRWFFTPGEFQRMPAAIHVTDHQLRGLTIRRRWLRPAGDILFMAVDITDGTFLYRLGVTVNYPDVTGDITLPILQWRDGRPWQLAPPHPPPTEGATSFTLDDLMLSAAGPFRDVTVTSEPVPHLTMGFAPLTTGKLAVFAAKTGPALSPGDSAIFAEVQGTEVVIRSSKEMWPALAAFYGTPQFECRVREDGSMTIVCEGEELKLPAP